MSHNVLPINKGRNQSCLRNTKTKKGYKNYKKRKLLNYNKKKIFIHTVIEKQLKYVRYY
jgi:hypothetical protein